jgi:hypothetical protein
VRGLSHPRWVCPVFGKRFQAQCLDNVLHYRIVCEMEPDSIRIAVAKLPALPAIKLLDGNCTQRDEKE